MSINTKIIKDELPEGVIIYHNEAFDAITVPDDGFEKLVAYYTQEKGTWVHKNFRKESKKSKKKA